MRKKLDTRFPAVSFLSPPYFWLTEATSIRIGCCCSVSWDLFFTGRFFLVILVMGVFFFFFFGIWFLGLLDMGVEWSVVLLFVDFGMRDWFLFGCFCWDLCSGFCLVRVLDWLFVGWICLGFWIRWKGLIGFMIFFDLYLLCLVFYLKCQSLGIEVFLITLFKACLVLKCRKSLYPISFYCVLLW